MGLLLLLGLSIVFIVIATAKLKLHPFLALRHCVAASSGQCIHVAWPCGGPCPLLSVFTT